MEALHLATRQHENFARFYPKLHKLVPQKEVAKNDGEDTSNKRLKSSPRRVFALDCEMVMTKQPGEESKDEVSTLARASLVELVKDDEFKPVLDLYVKLPSNVIVVDRLEHVSGITQENLDQATHSLSQVIDALNNEVDLEEDYVVGHSLYNDLSVLPGWEPVRVVETSFLFRVKSHPRLTLSLRDALWESARAEIHMDKAKPHDSVQDAIACLKICQAACTLPSPASSSTIYELEEVPARFRKQIVLQRVPRSAEQDLLALVRDLESRGAAHCKQVKWTEAHDQASVCIEFASEELAHEFFHEKLVVDVEDCHAKGFPYNRAGHLRKLIVLGKEQCEATSHLKMPMNRRMEFKCKQSEIGKILGSKGRQVLHMQKCCGVLITNTAVGKKEVLFEILADCTDKCEQAFMRLTLAQQGRYDC